MSRPKKNPLEKVEVKRLQFEVTLEELEQINLLQSYTRAASLRETIKTLVKIGLYIHDKSSAGEKTLDISTIRHFCFT